MDKFKPEDDLIPDPSDRQSGRTRNIDTDNEPQLNVDDIEIDMDDRRVSKARRVREDDENYELDEDMAMETRPPRGRRKAERTNKPISRQYLMMGTGIIVLLLLIFGIGSALKGPSPATDTAGQPSGTEKSIDLSATHENSNAPAVASASQDFSIPPISSTPTQGQSIPQPEGQQRIELQGDLGNSLTQQQTQIESVVTRSTLPTEPATVASVAGSKTTEPRPERKTVVIEPVQKAPNRTQITANTQSKPAPVKHNEPARVASTSAKPVVEKTAPVVHAPTAKAPVTQPPVSHAPAKSATAAGSSQALKSASGSSYTLQLNASSNSANLNAWAKKENLQNFIVYQTSRNGKPWYVMVSGIYASKSDAERAISNLPAGVQSNKPWTKPIHQVQSEIK